jgi:hypothetical protein
MIVCHVTTKLNFLCSVEDLKIALTELWTELGTGYEELMLLDVSDSANLYSVGIIVLPQ